MSGESLHWLRGASLLLLLQAATSMVMLPNATGWQQILDKYLDEDGDWWEAKQRGKRAITDSDAQVILDLHNKLRGQVYPPSSNMEHMVWDTELERTAEEWAETCLWEHGPAGLLPQIGQNLGAHLVFVTLLEDDSSYPPQEETEENNFIEQEAPRAPQKPRPRASKPELPSLPAPAPTKPPTEDLQLADVCRRKGLRSD